MMNSSEIADDFKSLAETNAINNLPGKAFAYYCLALEIRPEWSDDLKSSFSTALCDWGKILEHEERYNELFSSYEKALKLYPENELILNNLGAHLCRLQQPREALKYFKRAVEINNDYLPAYVNTQVTKSMLVERWHFRMLNDSIRNESYRMAISRRVTSGCRTVLDIGSGTGILSMYAKAAGAEAVYGCDYSETMVSISRDVLEDSGYLDSIQVINKLSTDLTVPEDIPARLSLVVTETFDGGLLGEHILETLIHAWENLLLPPSPEAPGRVLPNGAVLYIAPVESLHIARKKYVLKSTRIDRSSFNTGLNLSQLFFSSKLEEPYDTENLKSINCLYLSEPVRLFEFNFNNVLNLKEYYDGAIKNNITFQFKKKGYLDAFAVWFDLILDDEMIVTSSPLCEIRCCWEQAIFPLKEEILVNEKSSITIQASCKTGILSISPIQKNPPNSSKKYITVPESVISLLNSESLLLSLSRSFEGVWKLFGAKHISVLDLSVCPYLGALIADRMNSKVYCSNQIYETLSDVGQELLKNLNINTKNIVFLGWNDILLLIKEKKQTFDIIIVDVLESSGQMSEEIVGMIPLLRALLPTNGLLIPSELRVWCQLVYSEELVNSSEVKSSNDQLHIAKHINEYKVLQMIDFNLHDTQYIEVSESFLIGSLELQYATNEIILEKEIDSFKSSKVNAIIYWYGCKFFDDVEYSTFSSDSPINHAAALLDTSVDLQGVSKLKIKLQYNSGGMRFFVT